MSRLARLWRGNRWLVIGFLLACAVTLFFAVRMTVWAVYWSDPAHSDQALAGWMTPRYVAHSWQVSPDVVAEALDLGRDGSGRRVTLSDIAAARGITLDTLTAELEAAILTHRSDR